MKRLIIAAAVVLIITITTSSCTHNTEWCNGKVITIDTSLSTIVTQATVDTVNHILGSIYIDTTKDNANAYIKANIIRRPYSGSIDNGKTWSKLPINDTTLSVGTYKIIIKDGDGCESQVYTQKITY